MVKVWNTPKEYLNQVRYLNDRIKTELESIAELKQSLFRVNKELSQDKVQSNNNFDFTDIIAKICDMEEETNKLIDSFVDTRRVIEKEIRTLDNHLFSVILINHYVLDKSLVEIADDFSYSRSHVKHSHGWALEEFRNKFPEKFSKK